MRKLKCFHIVKRYVLLVCILAMLTPLSGSGAWLVHTSGIDSTTMQKGNVNVVAVPLTGYSLPNQLKVRNDGNVKAWVRVKFDINWTNEETNNWLTSSGWSSGRLIYGQAPRENSGTHVNGMPWTADYTWADYTADGHWLVGKEEKVFYFKYPVKPGDLTVQLTKNITVHHKTLTAQSQGVARTFNLTFDISVDAIQWEDPAKFSGTPAVVSEWGVTLNSNKDAITAVPPKDFIPPAAQ
ncbi:MAG: hypothetical protein IKT68_03210 [Clostridia bacterium]|nr:hypothetical protein [Clostridia bacterium]